MDSSARIKSLTIRGSNDNETIVLDGPLGLVGDKTVTIEAGAGDDKIYILGLDRPGTADAYGDIMIDGEYDTSLPGEGGHNELYVDDTRSATNNIYDITANTLTRRGRNPITFRNVQLLDLKTGTGENLVNQNGLPGSIKLRVAAGPTDQDKFAQLAGHSNDPRLTNFEILGIQGGTLTLLGTNGLAVREMTESGGILAGTATVSASATLAWTGGTMQDVGLTKALDGSFVSIEGPVTLNRRTFQSDGFATWKGDIDGDGQGTLLSTGLLSTAAGQVNIAGHLTNRGSLFPGAFGGIGRIWVTKHYEDSGVLNVDLGPGVDRSDQVVAETVDLSGTLLQSSVAGFPAAYYNVVHNLSGMPGGHFFSPAPGEVVTIDSKRYKMLYELDKTNWSKAVLRRVVDVGDLTWEDKNLNGVRDPYTPPSYPNPAGSGDPPVGGVPVALYRAADDALVATTVSSTSGYDYGQYRFVDVVVDDYYLRFGTPDANWRLTIQDAGPDDIDSDPNRFTGKTDTFSLSPLDNDLTRDAGLYRLGGIGNYVWNDYHFQGDGIQNDSYGGWGGLTVTLSPLGAGTGRAITTSSDGHYWFNQVEIRDDNWNPITYRLLFTKPPDSPSYRYRFSPANQGPDDTLDSDADPTTGIAQPITLLVSGSEDATIDCGIQMENVGSGGGYFAGFAVPTTARPDAIAGRMWVDEGGDGLRQDDELPVPGWRVERWEGGVKVAETWTDWGGGYRFDKPVTGPYRLRFAPPTDGVRFTAPDRGTDPTRDSDAGSDGWTEVMTGPAVFDAGLTRQGLYGWTVSWPAAGMGPPVPADWPANEPLRPNTRTPEANFFAGDPDNREGVGVAVKNVDDGRADLVAGPHVTADTGRKLAESVRDAEDFRNTKGS